MRLGDLEVVEQCAHVAHRSLNVVPGGVFGLIAAPVATHINGDDPVALRQLRHVAVLGPYFRGLQRSVNEQDIAA